MAVKKKCFTCGHGVASETKTILKAYKAMWEKAGVDRYFYKIKRNGEIFVVSKSNFSRIFNDVIKPNLINGAEYAHISEYNPKP